MKFYTIYECGKNLLVLALLQHANDERRRRCLANDMRTLLHGFYMMWMRQKDSRRRIVPASWRCTQEVALQEVCLLHMYIWEKCRSWAAAAPSRAFTRCSPV